MGRQPGVAPSSPRRAWLTLAESTVTSHLPEALSCPSDPVPRPVQKQRPGPLQSPPHCPGPTLGPLTALLPTQGQACEGS